MMLCEEIAGDVLGECQKSGAGRSRRAASTKRSRKHGRRSDDA